MDVVRHWLSTLQAALPHSLYDAPAEYYARLAELDATDVVRALNLQTLLPPLLSLLAIYFTLLSLYRTTSFLIRSTVFLVKWGAMIAAVVASLAYVANTFGAFDEDMWAPQAQRRTTRPRPRAWDTFPQHQQWRARDGSQRGADAGRLAREMVEKFIDATGQGEWWGSLAGLAAKVATQEDSTASGRRTQRSDGKGKIR